MPEYYSDSRPELIHCDFCGEDYADTYKACPFCDTAPNGKKVRSRSAAPAKGARSGRRVRTNTRGGGYGGAKSPLAIIGIILAVALVIAAVVIIAMLVKSTFGNAKDPSGTNSGVTSSITSQEDENATNSGDSGEDDGSVGVVAPDGLSLDQATATIHAGGSITLTATADPINWIGQIIWSTSDPAVATVDQNGEVTYAGDGTCTITASANGVTATCTVTCGGAQEPTQSSIVITCYGNDMDGDFTIRMSDGTLPFKATGGDGENYSWSTGDPSIAIVDPATGKVTPVGEGKTTLTCTSGDETTTVVLRVKN